MASASPRPATNEPTEELPGQQSSLFQTEEAQLWCCILTESLGQPAAAGVTSPVVLAPNARISRETSQRLYF